MKLSIPVVETIQKRHSVRTYENQSLLSQDRDALLKCMKQLDNPFDIPVHTHIIDQKLNVEGEKLGTYGVIKGASTFLGVNGAFEEMPQEDANLPENLHYMISWRIAE